MVSGSCSWGRGVLLPGSRLSGRGGKAFSGKPGMLCMGRVGVQSPRAIWGQLCRRQLTAGPEVLESSLGWECNGIWKESRNQGQPQSP